MAHKNICAKGVIQPKIDARDGQRQGRDNEQLSMSNEQEMTIELYHCSLFIENCFA